MTGAQTIVVTGVNGFIAGHLVKKVCRTYPDALVIGVGRQAHRQGISELANLEYVSADLCDSGALTRLPEKADTVIHFAGDRRSFVPSGEYSDQIRTNILATSQLADYAIRARASRFLFASSVYVYSGCANIPFREDFTEHPRENLGVSKFGAEAVLNARSCAGHFSSTSFRIFTTYGPGASQDQFLSAAIQKLLSPEPVAAFGNPEMRRDFVYVDDVVDAVMKSLQMDAGGMGIIGNKALNIGSGKATSIRDVVTMLAEILNVTKPIEFDVDAFPAREGDNCHQADLTKIGDCLGWTPNTSLDEGLQKLVLSLDGSS
ncbi:MAG: NAD(P)-dependent oxidoreductase [Rhodospirillaceae bacterium]|jgi:nucleoside-diphosphate-sugar epimerase|nr:NAD(P)-dependent oxidoreductase [Rhodospirillaceae bacterium]